MTKPRGIFTVILAAAILAAGLDYAWLLKAKINKLKNNIGILNNDKQALISYLSKEKKIYNILNAKYQKAQDKLRIAGDKLVEIDANFQNAQRTVEELNSRISILKAEGEILRKEKEEAKLDLNEVTQEKNTLQDKMSSITGLKKSDQGIKKNERRQVMRELASWILPKLKPPKPAAKEVKTQAAEIKTEEVLEGNRGFLIKDKKPTYQAKVKIEVEPFNR